MSKIQQLQCDQCHRATVADPPWNWWRVEPLGVTSFGQNPGPLDFCSATCLLEYFSKDRPAPTEADHPTRRLPPQAYTTSYGRSGG